MTDGSRDSQENQRPQEDQNVEVPDQEGQQPASNHKENDRPPALVAAGRLDNDHE